ncbi:type II secretion system minor pseudopilin GspJ [Iodobacter fluviatilis]|uniref:Type II secretion system protein J n=1 Tax=Iodobacter fluviatilis TaxID=537 RepID=A0A377QAJ7_9NEIS|nr:type II secretion system minor pseudopilin GspJ [Iodobacter fluviatilis]TCU89521.1 general secretion pathway protein J [Iodobacter fluviatilis]STQ90891.1 PilD-dependent protein pddD [Iodobacter fluviatilis]
MFPIKVLKPRHAGFTLLEILIALAVFSVVTLISYKGLESVAQTRSALDAEAKRWRDLSLVFDRMEEDVSQAVDRPWRDQGGVEQAAMRGTNKPERKDDQPLELIRLDRNRDAFHVAYRLNNGRLELLLWNALDLGPREEPQVHTLLENIRGFEVNFLDASSMWKPSWPLAGNSKVPPRGVKIKLTLADDTTVERIYTLP